MSRVLDRLQHTFNDELLVRTRNGLEPTHRALHIYSELNRLLPGIEELLRGDEFNPAEATHSFRIAATDYAVVALLPGLVEAMEQAAPGMQVEILAWDPDTYRKLVTNALDLALWVNQAPPPFRAEHLFREKYACLVRTGHPLGKRPLTLQRYLK
jgi:DNA-binding transcriptional LysR family regulator